MVFDLLWNGVKEEALKFFQKTKIVLPLNIDKHWSLCAVCNAAQAATFDENDHVEVKIPFLLFLDPLDFHYRS
jgi:Ulp1 family protease